MKAVDRSHVSHFELLFSVGVNDLRLVFAVNIDAAVAQAFFGQQEFDVATHE